MFLTWSLAEVWDWVVNLPFLGGLLLCVPTLLVMVINLTPERRRRS